MIILSQTAVVAAAFSPLSSSVVATTKAAARQKKASIHVLEALQMNNNNNADDNLTNNINKQQQQRQRQQWKQRLAKKNFGGRASRGRKGSRKGADASVLSTSRGGGNGLWKLLAPLVGLILILRLVFGGGGGGNDGSYYYYQSSSYESRVVMGDGRVDTARKKSVRSNIPGLIENNADRRESSSSSSIRILEEEKLAPLLPSAADFDDALNREIESIVRQERRMLDDFFY